MNPLHLNKFMENNMKVGIHKLNEKAKTPTYGTIHSACFDLYACIDEKVKAYNAQNFKVELDTILDESDTKRCVAVLPKQRALIGTGIVFDIPEDYSIRIHPRSGSSLKQGLILANCEAVIDSDYTEETFVMVHNISDNVIVIVDGDRIAQAELVKDLKVDFVDAERPTSNTRNGGFGSTGVK